MKLLTAEEMRAIDRATTERYGVPSLTLMENAGSAVAEFALKHFEFASVCIVCGKGNNGGDGFVAARKLHDEGNQVFVIALAAGADELRGDAAEMFKKLPVSAMWVPDAHKRDFAHVLVVGGSLGKSGAAGMAGLAALRTGAGLVTVASPKSVQPIIAAYAPELMTEPLAETNQGTISLLALANRDKWLQGKSVVVIGPGISRNEETAEFVRDLVSICPESLVLDADGLNAFEGHANDLRPAHDVPTPSARVLTPHPGEMSRL